MPSQYSLFATVIASASGLTVSVSGTAEGLVPAPANSPYLAYGDIDFGDGKVAVGNPADCSGATAPRQVSKTYSARHTYAISGRYAISFRTGACSPGPGRVVATAVVVV